MTKKIVQVWALFTGLLLSSTSLAMAATYTVNKYKDDGSVRTLRWAITQSNANPNPGGNVIEITSIGKAPYVIKTKSLLPALVGPVIVKGFEREVNGEMVPGIAIDGINFINGDDEKSCPGAGGRGYGPNVRSIEGAGLAIVDTGNVRVTDVEVRNFCIGIMILRSHDNQIDHDWVHNTSGAAGILVTGDDGTDAGGSTVGLTANNLIEYSKIYETGDGAECTRGSTNETFRFNTFYESRTRPNVPYSQGVECAGAGDDRISLIGNSFTGYSDGLQLNGATNFLVAGNIITGTTYGITASGSGLIIGNTITGNRMGIGPSPGSHITISQNNISDNGHANILSVAGSAGGTTDAASPALSGIYFNGRGAGGPPGGAAGRGGRPGALPGGAGGTVAAAAAPAMSAAPRPPAAPASPPPTPPALAADSEWADTAPVLKGNLTSQPNTNVKVDFYASHALDAAGAGEGEVYIGQTAVTTDANGNASFSFTGPTNPLGDHGSKAYFTATATSSSGSTSPFSAAVLLAH